MFENSVLRKICGPKKEEVCWEWIILRNEEFCGLFKRHSIIVGVKSIPFLGTSYIARVRMTTACRTLVHMSLGDYLKET
jgi:hypothetical protein